MTTINLKPISWVGDMYNRFESICLEVEEAVCQDTVKFVEDQVETVGVGVKKFYSDFMQDLFSPSLKTVTEDNLDVVLSKKSKVISEMKSVDIEAQQMVNNCGGIDDGNNSVDRAHCFLVECNVNKPYESNSNMSVEEQYANDDIESHFAELDLPNLGADVTKDLDERKDCESKFLSLTSRPNDLCESSELREIQKESNVTFCGAVDYSLNTNSVIETSCSENYGVGISQQMTEGFESSVVDGETIVPSIRNPFPNIAAVAGESNPQVAYRIQIGDVDEQVAPIDNKVTDEVKLGESCVLVEKSDHSFFLPPEHKQKSYKKKIRDVFIQRRWTKGKQDKKQNVVWYEDQTAKNLAPISPIQTSSKDSRSNEFVESEWELL